MGVSFEFYLRIRFVRRMYNTPPHLTSSKIQNISTTVHLFCTERFGVCKISRPASLTRKHKSYPSQGALGLVKREGSLKRASFFV